MEISNGIEKYGELLGSLLSRRGIKDEAQADIFLNPDYVRDLYDPYLMRDMERACIRLFEAVENKERIIVYADYDCDGIPGAVIMHDLFKLIGYKNYEVYIPERNSEGYGLNKDALQRFKESGAKLIITIDLGITAVDETAQAEVDGMDVIITDHHLPHEVLPRAYAILNPKVDDYPEKMLCGAGVIYKFVQGFIKKYGEYWKLRNGVEKWMLDMAGLATLSDMVPLTGENRAIAHFGMRVLRKSRRPGLQKLLAKMNIDQRYVSEDDIVFMVAPRLNAASRVDSPMRSYELLSADTAEKAGALADHLSKINNERKNIVTAIMREVHKKLEKKESGELREVIVVGNPNWRIGVLGLVAGKILDEHRRPVFVWGKDENDCIKGSCRSDGSVSVVELMTEARESFVNFGGHELAGGFTVATEKVHFLEETLSACFHKVKRPVEQPSGNDFDIKSDLNVVSMENWQKVEKLAPFGLGNKKPVFLFEGAKIEKIRTFGKNGSGEHIEVIFSDASGKKIPAVSFFSNENSFETSLEEGKTADLFATLDLSRFRGREELRLRIVDVA